MRRDPGQRDDDRPDRQGVHHVDVDQGVMSWDHRPTHKLKLAETVKTGIKGGLILFNENGEAGPLAGDALYVDLRAVDRDDSVDDRKPEPRARRVLFGVFRAEK